MVSRCDELNLDLMMMMVQGGHLPLSSVKSFSIVTIVRVLSAL